MGKMCRYCHFECPYKGDEEICPLTKVDDPFVQCWDVDCEYDEDCDICISYREG